MADLGVRMYIRKQTWACACIYMADLLIHLSRATRCTSGPGSVVGPSDYSEGDMLDSRFNPVNYEADKSSRGGLRSIHYICSNSNNSHLKTDTLNSRPETTS